MELEGYKPYAGPERVITSQDKLVRMDPTGEETVVNILLTRRTNLICRTEGAPNKFELFFTTWSQEDGVPLIHAGSTFRLFVPVGAAAAPVAAKREKPAKGESKLDKCRAIFKANASLDKVAIKKLFIEAGCTEGGANTYYLMIKKENG
jgi:hypothetical protein